MRTLGTVSFASVLCHTPVTSAMTSCAVKVCATTASGALQANASWTLMPSHATWARSVLTNIATKEPALGTVMSVQKKLIAAHHALQWMKFHNAAIVHRIVSYCLTRIKLARNVTMAMT